MIQRELNAGGIIFGDGGRVKDAGPCHPKLVVYGEIDAKKAVSANLKLGMEVTNREVDGSPSISVWWLNLPRREECVEQTFILKGKTYQIYREGPSIVVGC